MAKVIQIRGVPDDVHAKLVSAAERAGTSLTAYLLDEVGRLASKADVVEHNRRVILAAQAELGPLEVTRADTLRAIEEGRADRDRQLDELVRSRSRT